MKEILPSAQGQSEPAGVSTMIGWIVKSLRPLTSTRSDAVFALRLVEVRLGK